MIGFILSSPRAGSTLLRAMLCGHPEIFAPPELHLLQFDYMHERREAFERDETTYLAEGLERAIVELKGCSIAESRVLIGNLESARARTRDVYRLLERLARTRYVIDKTPWYTRNPKTLDSIPAAFSDAKYIFIHRHPLSSVHSFLRTKMHLLSLRAEPDAFVGFTEYEIAESVWARCNGNTLAFLRTLPDGCYRRVAFESLVSDVESTLRSMCAFLELDFSPDMLDPYAPGRMVDRLDGHSVPVGDPTFLSRSEIELKVAHLHKRLPQVRRFEPRVIALAEALGYEMEEDSLGSLA